MSQVPMQQITLISGMDNQRYAKMLNVNYCEPANQFRPLFIRHFHFHCTFLFRFLVVLTAASKNSAASLGENFVEGSHDEFTFNGTDGVTLKRIVDYCYSGYIDFTVDDVKTFVTIASSFELVLLVKESRKCYDRNLSPNSAV